MPDHQIIFGLHTIYALLNANPDCIKQMYVDKKRNDKRSQDIIQQAREKGVEISFAQRDELDKMSHGGNHQGVAAYCEMPRTRDESLLDEIVEQQAQPLFLVLDGVQDPHNLGACLRTADAAGVHAVIIPKDRSVAFTSTVVKVASGAAFTVPLVSVTNLSRIIRHLQDTGIWFVGTDGASTQSLYELSLTGPVAIVMGAEGSGIRRLTKELCDYLVRLPMQGTVESLNVSVATGVCLYEVLRQRTGSLPAG